jgi:hypothetical protein
MYITFKYWRGREGEQGMKFTGTNIHETANTSCFGTWICGTFPRPTLPPIPRVCPQIIRGNTHHIWVQAPTLTCAYVRVQGQFSDRRIGIRALQLSNAGPLAAWSVGNLKYLGDLICTDLTTCQTRSSTNPPHLPLNQPQTLFIVSRQGRALARELQ